MASLSGTITIEGIIKAIDRISAYINKDKNAICLTLILTAKNIELWQNELVDRLTPEMTNNLKLEGKERTISDINDIIRFCKTVKNSTVANDCVERIDEIVNRYQRGEHRKLINELNVKNLNIIKAKVQSFSLSTVEEKKLHFSLEKLSRPYSGKLAATRIYDWLEEKEESAREISKLVSNQCARLQCDHTKIWALYDKLQ